MDKQDISNMTFVVEDFVYAAKANAFEKNKITVYETKKLTFRIVN